MRYTRLLAFSPPRLWQVLGDDGRVSLTWTDRPQGIWRNAPVQWVIDRSQCVFRCLDLSHVPRAQRSQALSVKITGLSPFRLPGHYAAWRGGWVMLWIWDKEVQEGLANGESDVPSHYRCVPETVLLGMMADVPHPTLRLLQVRRGFDLQVWKAGVLILSIQYPQRPTVEQIQQVTRGIAALEASSPLEVQENYLDAPWGGGWQSIQGDWERWLPHGLCALLLLGCATQLSQGVAWWSESRQLQEDYSRLAQQIEPLLDARNRAEQASLAVAELDRRMREPSSQIELLRKLSSLLPPDTRLLSWRLRSGELEVQILTDNVDPRFFVERLQQQAHFRNVRVEPAPAGAGLRLLMSMSQESKQ